MSRFLCFAPKFVHFLREELLALTLVNFSGSFFQTFVAGGSFSGSALIMSYEATSLIHNFVNSFIMLLILVAMTAVIEPLPKATLASVILVALPRLVDFNRPRKLYHTKFDEFLLWVGTFCVTLFGGTQYGIFAGIGLSLLVIISRSISAPITEVGELPETSIYRSLERFPDARRIPHIRIFRLDSSINFANAAMFENRLRQSLVTYMTENTGQKNHTFGRLRRLILKRKGVTKDKRQKRAAIEEVAPDEAQIGRASVIVLSCEAINNLDTPAIAMLSNFSKKCKEFNMELRFSGFKVSLKEYSGSNTLKDIRRAGWF